MTRPYRVVIADDHRLVRQGIRALLLSLTDVEIVAEVENGREAIRCLDETDADLVLMDLAMPGMNGIEAVSEIKAQHPSLKILVLTVHAEEEFVDACVRAGVNGYIVKDASREAFLTAVCDVLRGQTYLCSVAAEKVIGRLVAMAKMTEHASPFYVLTHRERQVLQLIAEGQTNKTAAKFLSISPKTVEKHRSNIMAKLSIHSTAELTAFALRSGFAQRWTAAKSAAVSVLVQAGDWFEFAAVTPFA